MRPPWGKLVLDHWVFLKLLETHSSMPMWTQIRKSRLGSRLRFGGCCQTHPLPSPEPPSLLPLLPPHSTFPHSALPPCPASPTSLLQGVPPVVHASMPGWSTFYYCNRTVSTGKTLVPAGKSDRTGLLYFERRLPSQTSLGRHFS